MDFLSGCHQSLLHKFLYKSIFWRSICLPWNVPRTVPTLILPRWFGLHLHIKNVSISKTHVRMFSLGRCVRRGHKKVNTGGIEVKSQSQSLTLQNKCLIALRRQWLTGPHLREHVVFTPCVYHPVHRSVHVHVCAHANRKHIVDSAVWGTVNDVLPSPLADESRQERGTASSFPNFSVLGARKLWSSVDDSCKQTVAWVTIWYMLVGM